MFQEAHLDCDSGIINGEWGDNSNKFCLSKYHMHVFIKVVPKFSS